MILKQHLVKKSGLEAILSFLKNKILKIAHVTKETNRNAPRACHLKLVRRPLRSLIKFSPFKAGSVYMSSAEVQSVFDLEEEHNPYSYQAEESIASQQNLNNLSTESPGNFLNNLQAKPESPAAISDNPSITIDPLNSSNQLKQPEFMPAISPSMMLSSMASSSPAAENILSSAKERISQIRPWKDFFALDQFRIPESSTAAQSRVSHNFTHFQNNYLVIILLLTGFSL